MWFRLMNSMLAGVASIGMVAPVLAQAAPSPGAGMADTPGVQASPQSDAATAEIVVTAQNRSQRVQDVPIAISVVSGDTIQKQGVTDFTAVARLAPALQVTSDTTNTRVAVRGVGSISNNEAADQSIAVDIDGEYINRPTILNAAIFDIDRVEVLRGPQGTLYGRNSTGGAVNFITRKPRNEFGVNGSLTYGNYNQRIVDGGIDIPAGDDVAFRVAGIYTAHDGYFSHDNTPVQTGAFTPIVKTHSGNENTWGVRGSVKLTPIAGLRVDAAVEHFRQDFTPALQAYVDLNGAAANPGPNCNRNGFVVVGPNTPGVQCVPANTNFLSGIDRKRYNTPLTGAGLFVQNSTAVRGRVAYDFGLGTVTYTGGYRSTDNHGGNALGPAYFFTNFGASVKTQSHELRFNGVTSGIVWQFGGFYFKEKQDTDGGLYNPFIGPNGSYVNYFQHPTTSDSKSVFGQVEVPLVEKLTAVGGVRYTKDSRSAVYRNGGFIFNLGPVKLSPPFGTTLNLGFDGSKVSWLGGLNYKPDNNTLVYAKVSTGYKAGGFDSTGSTFQAETNTAYEGGLKMNFGPKHQHIFNVAGFYYDYKNLQNDVVLNAATGAQTFNAGKATVYGVEAEASFKLSRLDTFTANFNYLHARYDKFLASYAVFDTTNPNLTTLNPADNPDLRGNALPQAPTYVIGVGYDHTFELGSAGTVTASVYSRFKSRYYLDFFNYRDSSQSAFTQTDLSLEYKPLNGRFTIQGFVRNLENIRPVVFANYQAAGPDDVYNWQFGAPRTYGARFIFAF